MTIVASNSLTLSKVNDGTITHTAWSYSADGTDRFTTVYPNLNLLMGTSGPFVMGYGIPNTTWDTTNKVSRISLPVTTTANEVLPQGTGFPYTYIPGETYTQSIYISTDAPLTGTPISFTWFTVPYGHNTAGLDKLVKVSTNIYIATSTYTWPSSKSPVNGRNADFYNLTQVFDFTKGTFLQFYKPKLEQGSTATPLMPSESEVTTADWPSHIGQYTDFTQAGSTNPSAYTWSLIRGNDGKDGANGADGIAGKDGKGIKATAITYQASANGTTAPTGTWSASVPTVAKGSFLWTRTIWTYTDNTTETGYAVAYMGTNGNNGTDGIAGKDGVGIKTTTITYVGSTSGTTAPTSGWTSTVPTVASGSYLWTKTVWTYTDNTSETGYSVARMGLKGDKGDQGIKGNDGTDGTSGIIVSSVAPASPQTGQLWQDTSTTPQLVKKWTGNEWVIWEFYAQNLIADNISTISLNLGDMTGGTVKLMADVDVNGTLKKHGIYQSKLGLLSSGPSLATSSTLSNSQMGVANLNKGELRFIVTDYTENLKNVQEAGMSDQNNAFIKFDSYDNGKDVMTIGSSGDIVFKGITSQDTPWTAMLNGTYYKNMFSRVYISYSVKATSTANISLGVLPVGLRPFRGLHLTANAWGTTISNDRHIEVRTTGEVTLYNPANGASYDGEVSFTL